MYTHQDQAIQRVVQASRNVVVATGTGSGKTESFLIPIFDHLLREREAGTLVQPGVRALLLYPMNALANDQLKRLRGMLAHFPDITFGRYTGETPDTRRKAEELHRQQHGGRAPLRNELISREEMQQAPPHILVTNYAMLEYLLLRPSDTPFFDGQTGRHWRFIALDEAHIYGGATGIEIGMLLRRVKDRVVQSGPGRLRCMATSATIGANLDAVARFAQELFGETFSPDDILQGQRVNMAELARPWGEPQTHCYTSLVAAVAREARIDELATVARDGGAPAEVVQSAEGAALKAPAEERDNQFLYQLLAGDNRLHRLRDLLRDRPRLLSDVTSALGLDNSDAEAVVKLIELAVQARPNADALPLLPARYHVFARALEGAFVCLNSDAPAHREQGRPQIFLSRYERCPECDATVFELATCPRCGTAYIVGEEVSEGSSSLRRLRQAKLNASDDPQRGLSYLSLDRFAQLSDEDDAVIGAEDVDHLDREETDPVIVCLGCGAISMHLERRPACGCAPSTPTARLQRIMTQDDRLKKCVRCGARSSVGAVYRFLTGQDAPVSVLATSLYQLLPPDPNPRASRLPGQGRKLLTFADSRQDAAFFAPYLERTYHGILRRRMILQALDQDAAGRAGRLRLQDLAPRIIELGEKACLFAPDESHDGMQRIASQWLMQELIALDPQKALGGLGLLDIHLAPPKGWTPPSPLATAPWSLTPDEAWVLVTVLLESVRQSGAVTFPANVNPKDEAFAPRNVAMYLGETADSPNHILGWTPRRGANRRQDYLSRWLQRRVGMDKSAAEREASVLLRGLWQHLTDPDDVWADYLVSEYTSAGSVAFRLSHRLYQWAPVSADLSVYRCSDCFGITYTNLHGLCPKLGCPGTLKPLPLEILVDLDNHYRHLYTSMTPTPLQAQEHTAQWDPRKGGEVQADFIGGKINVLSCSTTFELGVDVGELQAVLMRNVPPTTANYVQRAGRAGRRSDSVAFVLTYAQRRSHDLIHYQDPVKMVSGQVPAPAVCVNNEKIVRRHVHSTVLAAFLRWAKDSRGREFRSVGEFFAPEGGSVSGPHLLADYLRLRPAELQAALRRIVPQSLQGELGLDEWDWIEQLTDPQQRGVLDRAALEVEDELSIYRKMEQEARNEPKPNYGRAKHYQRVADTLRGQPLINFLGSRNVLPEYGFPSDVVELQTRHLDTEAAKSVRLTRPLKQAIADYAPGSQLVAAKQVWTSAGLLPHPKMDWRGFDYAICPRCGRFYRDVQLATTHCICGTSLLSPRARHGRCIKPEFGFLASGATTAAGEQRPRRTYASRTYFWEYGPALYGEELPLATVAELSHDSIEVERKYSRYGRLVVVNSGLANNGFSICRTCGWGEPYSPPTPGRKRRRASHKNPRTGKECPGGFVENHVHLGHEFMTDVLEIRFRGTGEDPYHFALWLSLLYALLEGASEELNIARDDLDGTLHPYDQSEAPAIILFDNVPGGAGHVRRVADHLPQVLEAALRRVSHEDCGAETSCYGCLRNFYNQWCHDDLKRGLACGFLTRVLQRQGAVA